MWTIIIIIFVLAVLASGADATYRRAKAAEEIAAEHRRRYRIDQKKLKRVKKYSPKAIKAGRRAFEKGIEWEENPYSEENDSDLHWVWFNAWIKAEARTIPIARKRGGKAYSRARPRDSNPFDCPTNTGAQKAAWVELSIAWDEGWDAAKWRAEARARSLGQRASQRRESVEANPFDDDLNADLHNAWFEGWVSHRHQLARSAGQRAWRRGLELSQNPFDASESDVVLSHKMWAKGWNEQSQDSYRYVFLFYRWLKRLLSIVSK